jgi:hypothetical protein
VPQNPPLLVNPWRVDIVFVEDAIRRAEALAARLRRAEDAPGKTLAAQHRALLRRTEVHLVHLWRQQQLLLTKAWLLARADPVRADP